MSKMIRKRDGDIISGIFLSAALIYLPWWKLIGLL